MRGSSWGRAMVMLGVVVAAVAGPAAVTMVPATARAQQEPQDPVVKEARELVRRGNAAYQVGRIEEARSLYERAHQLRPRPGTLFNLAQCYRQLRQYTKAIFLYRSYLENAPGAPDRASVEQTIEGLKELQARETSPAAPAPAPAVSGVLPARDAADRSTAAGPVDEPVSRPWYGRWYVWAAVGAVVAGAVAAGVVLGTRTSTVEVPVPQSGLGNMGFFGGR